MDGSMDAKLRELVRELVADLSALVREAALEAAHEALRREGAPTRARAERATRPSATRRKKRGLVRGVERGPVEAVLQELRRKPHQRAEELAAALGVEPVAVRRALTVLAVEQRVAADGVGRGMRYRPAEVERLVELVPARPPLRRRAAPRAKERAVEPSEAAAPSASEPPVAAPEARAEPESAAQPEDTAQPLANVEPDIAAQPEGESAAEPTPAEPALVTTDEPR